MTRLQFVLRLNAISCLGFGLLFAARPSSVADTLGDAPSVIILAIGAALLVNGLHLLIAASRPVVLTGEVVWFSLGDLVWWLATTAFIALDLWITSSLGVTLALVVGLLVAALGVAQLFVLGQQRSGLNASDHARRIGRSWRSLPLWVKIWLFALNAAFLAAPAVLVWEDARIVLLAYVASGPLLAALAVVAGGLTRSMGVAHLIPWVPLLSWLGMRIADLDGSDRSFAVGLAGMVAICLGFDVRDLWNWVAGDRSIIWADGRGWLTS